MKYSDDLPRGEGVARLSARCVLVSVRARGEARRKDRAADRRVKGDFRTL